MSAPTRKELAQVILDLLDSGKSAETVAKDVAEYLVAERRTRELTNLMRDVRNLRLAKHGILEADVASAYELTPAIEKEIKDLFGASRTLLNYAHDPELIGGARVTTTTQQLDVSVEQKLNQLKHADLGV